ncbi:MAG TPA: RidA family protein [Gemmatimonadaceae bacterium]|nr:RidA family protein [Gemmatimonadaceae bacterium]
MASARDLGRALEALVSMARGGGAGGVERGDGEAKMTSENRIPARLHAMGLELPRPSTPGANYVQFVRTGDLLFLTGQLSQWNGERRFIGKLGREYGVAEGREAARLCALNLLAHLGTAVGGDWSRVVRCVRVAGYVNGAADFVEQSQVVNGASDLFVDLFGDAGRHTRMAVGVAALPYDVAVEVEAVFEIR